MKSLVQQFIRFAFVGVLATLIDFLVLYLLHNQLGLHYLIGTVAGFVVSTIFNYYASMKHVFKSKVQENDTQGRRREFMIFLALSIVGLALTSGLMWLLVSYMSFSVFISKLFTTGLVMVFNFVSRKLLLEGD